MSTRDPRARDAMLLRVRSANGVIAVAAAAATAAFSVAAAHAFKGHDGRKRLVRPTAAALREPAAPAVSVPGPQRIPAITGAPPPPPQPLAAPAQPPVSVPQAPAAAAPATSGGS
jgi:hypothetical protein